MSSLRIRVYVAGPISLGNVQENIHNGIAAGLSLLQAGYAPFIPHLSHLVDPDAFIGTDQYENWLSHDFSWVAACHAVLRIPGLSHGADREVAFARANNIPVFETLDALMAEIPNYGGDARFDGWLSRLSRLHARKQHDYGATTDPFANVRASQDFGVRPWIGALIRLNDKINRLKRFAERGTLANETALDSMVDIAVYALIAAILYTEFDSGQDKRDKEGDADAHTKTIPEQNGRDHVA